MSRSLNQSVNRDLGKALHHYKMIDHGDRILVGVSGGKDSLALLTLLQARLARIPITYALVPVYIDPGFSGGFSRALQQYLDGMGFSLCIEKTDYGLVAHSDKNRENPCFLCARLRRKRLFEIADEAGCNKIAFGHHKDDIIETFFLNLFYSGNISTMRPIQSFFNGKITVIRPLAYVDEDRIRRLAAAQAFPDFCNPCPRAKISKRKEIKDMLDQLYRSNKKVKGNVFSALKNVNPDYLL